MNSENPAGIINVLIMVFFVVVMYFFMLRPNSKRRKQEESMRNNIQVGDEIITIGGIVGRVVAIKDNNESFIIETGVDKSKVKIKKWAIASCESNNNSSEQK